MREKSIFALLMTHYRAHLEISTEPGQGLKAGDLAGRPPELFACALAKTDSTFGIRSVDAP